MWFFECDHADLQGKRFWLRPGTKFDFRRSTDKTKSYGVANQFIINDKSISRFHLTIEVANVKAGDGSRPGNRSELSIQDHGAKFGTLLDGESIQGKRVILQGEKHEVKLGRCANVLRITWEPAVFTLNLSSKEVGNGALQSILEKLEPLDIKCLDKYHRERTTHVLTKKRNTSKTLQALVNGRYIAHQDPFLNAVFAAGSTPDTGGKSQLEEDFDKYWPDALEYLPPQGTEPTQLSASAYFPDPTRQSIFEGYSFIFYDEVQFNNLQEPITNGGGKAFITKVVTDVSTSVDDFVRYVKSVAGEKGLGEFEDGSEGKGVVVVRCVPKVDPNGWHADFITKTSQLLDHRPIEQSEFLDAILRNDASVLRRPLEPAPSGTTIAPSGVVGSSFAERPGCQNGESPAIQQTPAMSAPKTAPRTTGRSKRTITSRFKGFVDSSDESDSAPKPSSYALNTPAAVNAASQDSSMFLPEREQTPVASQAVPAQCQEPQKSSRKRPAPEDQMSSVMSQLAPTTLGFKRRRLEEQAARRERGELSPPPAVIEKPKPEPLTKKPKKVEKELNVLELAREKRQRDAEVAAADRVASKASLEDIDIDGIRDLCIIEEMEVRRTAPPVSREEHGDKPPGWDAKWDGRKDFKRFNRRAQGVPVARPPKLIVELDEVKKKDYGMGPAYWGNGAQRKKKGKGKRKETPSTRRGRLGDDSSDDDDDNDDDVMDVDSDAAPSVSARSQRSSTIQSQSTSTIKQTNTTKTSQGQKRPAAAPLKNPPAAKKAKQTQVEDDDSDDSDAEKFKFRGRKK